VTERCSTALYSTGLRRSELLGLQLTDLDRERSLVLVRCGKGMKDRFVPIGGRALAWIDKYLAEVRPQLVQGESTPVLFLTSTPRRMHPNHPSALVRRYFEAAGLDYAGACHLPAPLCCHADAGKRRRHTFLAGSVGS